ncbi:hypothetical protein FSOLCH5_002243 [Fusarium solani]|jgi:hypothetical protein
MVPLSTVNVRQDAWIQRFQLQQVMVHRSRCQVGLQAVARLTEPAQAHSVSNQDGCALSYITKDQSQLSHRAQNLAGCRSRASSLCAGAEDGVAPAFVVEKAERVETVGNSTKASTKPMGIRARGRWPGSLGDARVGFLSVGSGVGDGVELLPGKKQGRR